MSPLSQTPFLQPVCRERAAWAHDPCPPWLAPPPPLHSPVPGCQPQLAVPSVRSPLERQLCSSQRFLALSLAAPGEQARRPPAPESKAATL